MALCCWSVSPGRRAAALAAAAPARQPRHLARGPPAQRARGGRRRLRHHRHRRGRAGLVQQAERGARGLRHTRRSGRGRRSGGGGAAGSSRSPSLLLSPSSPLLASSTSTARSSPAWAHPRRHVRSRPAGTARGARVPERRPAVLAGAGRNIAPDHLRMRQHAHSVCAAEPETRLASEASHWPVSSSDASWRALCAPRTWCATHR